MDGDGRMALHGMWLFEPHGRRGGKELIFQQLFENKYNPDYKDYREVLNNEY